MLPRVPCCSAAQPDSPRYTSIFEVAAYSVLHQFLQVLPILSLGEDTMTECFGIVSTFNRFGYYKDDFGLAHTEFFDFVSHLAWEPAEKNQMTSLAMPGPPSPFSCALIHGYATK